MKERVQYSWVVELHYKFPEGDISGIPRNVDFVRDGDMVFLNFSTSWFDLSKKAVMDEKVLRMIFELMKVCLKNSAKFISGSARLGVMSPFPATYVKLPALLMRLCAGVSIEIEVDFYVGNMDIELDPENRV